MQHKTAKETQTQMQGQAMTVPDTNNVLHITEQLVHIHLPTCIEKLGLCKVCFLI